MKPISLQLYTLRETAKDDFFGVLAQVAEIGYKGVEPAGLGGHKPAEVRKVLDDLGLVASSTHGSLVTPENLNESIDTAKTLGYEMIIAGWKKDDWLTLDGIKRGAEAFQRAAELLAGHGLRMGYHNHWWEMAPVEGKLGLEHFIELAPGAFSQLDTYWAANFGAVDVPALLARHAGRVPTLHIKDGPLVEGEPHTAIGAGAMDVPAVIAAADDGVLEWIVVELDACATDMLTAVRESYAYITGEGLAEGNK